MKLIEKGGIMPDASRQFNERRKFARANIYAITRYFCPTHNNAIVVQTRISDISEGGVMMVTFKEQLPKDASINISFVMPGVNGQLVTVSGKVRYTEHLEEDLYRSGIEFLKLEKKDQLSIREYVVSRSKK